MKGKEYIALLYLQKWVWLWGKVYLLSYFQTYLTLEYHKNLLTLQNMVNETSYWYYTWYFLYLILTLTALCNMLEHLSQCYGNWRSASYVIISIKLQICAVTILLCIISRNVSVCKKNILSFFFPHNCNKTHVLQMFCETKDMKKALKHTESLSGL